MIYTYSHNYIDIVWRLEHEARKLHQRYFDIRNFCVGCMWVTFFLNISVLKLEFWILFSCRTHAVCSESILLLLWLILC